MGPCNCMIDLLVLLGCYLTGLYHLLVSSDPTLKSMI
jgi:hypothetical protein